MKCILSFRREHLTFCCFAKKTSYHIVYWISSFCVCSVVGEIRDKKNWLHFDVWAHDAVSCYKHFFVLIVSDVDLCRIRRNCENDKPRFTWYSVEYSKHKVSKRIKYGTVCSFIWAIIVPFRKSKPFLAVWNWNWEMEKIIILVWRKCPLEKNENLCTYICILYTNSILDTIEYKKLSLKYNRLN